MRHNMIITRMYNIDHSCGTHKNIQNGYFGMGVHKGHIKNHKNLQKLALFWCDVIRFYDKHSETINLYYFHWNCCSLCWLLLLIAIIDSYYCYWSYWCCIKVRRNNNNEDILVYCCVYILLNYIVACLLIDLDLCDISFDS